MCFIFHHNRWSGFEECVEGLLKWLKEAEASLPEEPELKATLDEKRAQLQVYRYCFQTVCLITSCILRLASQSLCFFFGINKNKHK